MLGDLKKQAWDWVIQNKTSDGLSLHDGNFHIHAQTAVVWMADFAKNLFTTEQVLAVLRNVGIDTECGACCEIAFTGVTTAEHTHKKEDGHAR